MSNIPICPYCGNKSELVQGDLIYPHLKQLHHKYFYQCAPCHAYVGCHRNSQKPMGRLANWKLRKTKQATHAVFDPIWKEQHMSRTEAYHWLSQHVDLPKDKVHIGEFDLETCRKVQVLSKSKLIDLRKKL